jgi:poly(A) polymerase
MKRIYSYSDAKKFPWLQRMSAEFLDRDAVKIVRRLRQCRHAAYFVGGCIRDLLLGRRPKDFDIVTAARPQEIRRIFRNSRIIGRRFLLVHVVFGEKIVEVATFRRAPSHEEKNLPVKQDNFFGTDEEDVLRRDFTINALFYDPYEEQIIDYVGGIEDLRAGKIRIIGDAAVRFQEDPIRILRALKLSAQLGFTMVPEVKEAIPQNCARLAQASSERIVLEVIKILQSGAAFACLQQMAEYQVLPVIMPHVARIWNDASNPCQQLLCRCLQQLDKIPAQTRSQLNDATLFAVLCLPLVFYNLQKPLQTLEENFCLKQLAEFAESLHLCNGLIVTISRIISLQLYLERAMRNGNCGSRPKLMRKNYFRQALDFLYLRTYQDTATEGIYQFWHERLPKQGRTAMKSR